MPDNARSNSFGSDEPDLSPELARLDAMLRRGAGGVHVPEGLAGRVFEASASHLPQPQRLRFPSPTPASSSRPPRRLVTWGSRLALAACLGLAFIGSALFITQSGPTDDGLPIARGLDAPREVILTGHEPAPLSKDAERLLWSGVEVAYLFETRDMTYDAVSGELRAMVNEFEM